jgi:hypothetical protein
MNPTRFGRYDACVLLGSMLFLCLMLWSLRTTPFLLGGDEQLFWTNAQRMLQGDVIYRDFYEFTPPGADLLYLGAFKLLGSRIWVPNVVMLVFGTSLCWLCFRMARSIMRPAPAALAAGLVLMPDFGYWLDGTHHWFSVFSVLAATAVLMPARTRSRILIAGALCGLASFFTQTRGVAAAMGFTAFLFWDRYWMRQSWRVLSERLGLVLSGFAVMWLALSSYFLVETGISRIWYFQVIHVLRYIITDWHSLLAWDGLLSNWPLHTLCLVVALPIIFALTLRRQVRAPADSAAHESGGATLLMFAGASMYAEVAVNPNPFRVDCVAIPGILLLVWLLAGEGRATSRCHSYAITICWLVIGALGAHRIWHRNVERSVIEDLPAGRIAAIPVTAAKLDWIAHHTSPGQYFCEATYWSMYVPLGLRVPFFAPLGVQTSPEFLEKDLRQLEAAHVHYILWSPQDRPRFPKFEQFLFGHYRLVQEFAGQEQIWELLAQSGSPSGS